MDLSDDDDGSYLVFRNMGIIKVATLLGAAMLLVCSLRGQWEQRPQFYVVPEARIVDDPVTKDYEALCQFLRRNLNLILRMDGPVYLGFLGKDFLEENL